MTNHTSHTAIPDHIIREVVNKLRDNAILYHATGQLRERMREAIEPLLASALHHHDKVATVVEPAKNATAQSNIASQPVEGE